MNKTLVVGIGFLLFFFGMVAIVLSIVGVQLTFLTFIDAPGRLFGFVMRILMVVIGIVMVFLAKSDFAGEGGI